MTPLPKQLVAEAFALSNARGADLLAQLGTFRVWRGDLATMRGDTPRAPEPDGEAEATRDDEKDALVDTLVLARAIELLQPDCREALTAIYADHTSDDSHAQKIRTDCEQRLFEIYESLRETACVRSEAMPRCFMSTGTSRTSRELRS